MKRSFVTILSVVLLFSVGLLWAGGGQEAKPAAGGGLNAVRPAGVLAAA